MTLAALGPAGEYRTRTTMAVRDAAGDVAFELSSVPPLVVSHWFETIRSGPKLSLDETPTVLAKAADLFAGGLADHEARLARLTGTPLPVVRECDELIIATLRDPTRQNRLARPAGAVAPEAGLPGQGATWRRVGDLFTVHAAGNSPGVHESWLAALALGYRVVVRPSVRDPLTAHRLISALRAAGVPDTQVVLAPTDHATAGTLVDNADLALVYGGQQVVEAYRLRRDVLVRGPGRSKLAVCADADRRVGLELAVAGTLYHAGTACTGTTGILVEHDPTGFSHELADLLRSTPVAPPWSEDARLPGMTEEQASALVSAVTSRVGADALRLAPTARTVGSVSVVTPSVVELASPTDPLLGLELPFPCVWVAPFDSAVPEVLDGSLVVALHTGDPDLVSKVADLPGVSNVYQGLPTSWSAPDVPHDGYLAEFLMRTRGYGHDRR